MPERSRKVPLQIRVPPEQHTYLHSWVMFLRDHPEKWKDLDRVKAGLDTELEQFRKEMIERMDQLDQLVSTVHREASATPIQPVATPRKRRGDSRLPAAKTANLYLLRAVELCAVRISEKEGSDRPLRTAEIENQLRREFDVKRGPAQSAAHRAVAAVDPGNPQRRSRGPAIARRVDVDQVGEMRRLEGEKWTRAEIAKRLGCHPRTIRHHLGPSPAQRTPHRVSAGEIEKMRAWDRQGYSRYLIALRIGCSRHTVRKHLGPKVVQRKRAAPKITAEMVATMKKLSAAGRTRRSIAREIGCHVRSIYKYLGPKKGKSV